MQPMLLVIECQNKLISASMDLIQESTALVLELRLLERMDPRYFCLQASWLLGNLLILLSKYVKQVCK